MKQKNYQRWSRPLLLTLLSIFMAFSGANSAWAGTGDQNFNSMTASDFKTSYSNTDAATSWYVIGGTIDAYGSGNYTIATDKRIGTSGKGLFTSQGSNTAFIVTPLMTGDVTIYFGRYNKYAGSVHVYEAIENGSTFTCGNVDLMTAISYSSVSSATTSFTQSTISLGTASKRLAIVMTRACMDDFAGDLGTAGPVAVTGVSLNKTSTSLVVGQNETLTATIAPANATNKNVSWSVTAGDTYASVSDEGVVTAVAPGEATVTVTTEDGGFTASCNVTVTAVVNVTSVSLNKTETSLFVGENETLTATVSPDGATNKNISWESSDPTVVSVVDGELTALKAGTATITVTTEDGAKTATCAVTVSNVVVTGVTLDVTSANLIAGGTVTLTPTVAPSNATNKNVSWESDATGVATVDNGVVTAVAPGTAHITVTTEDGGHTASCTITVLPSLTVHDKTNTSSYVPVNGYYADYYLKSEFVMPASELSAMDGGTISAMTFYLSTSASAAWTGTFNVFIKEVDNTTLAAYSGTEGATSVYTGTLDATGSIMTINFGSTYKYNGGNLLVGIYQTGTGNYKSATFYGETVSGASLYGYNSSSLSSVSTNQGNFIPKTTFIYTPGTPKAKMVVTPTALDFGTISSSSTAEDKQKTFTISNAKTNADLTGLTVSCESEGYAVSALPRTTITGTGEDHADIELTVTFSGTTEKVYNGTVTVSATDMTPIEVSLTATYADADATIEVTEAGSVESVDGTTVAFGEKGKQVTKTFTIANGGDKTLHVTSITSNNTTDFTVSPASVDVAGHSSANFTVTFVWDGEALDAEKTATITVNSDAGNKSFTVTGTRINQWSEDFSGGELPTGWDAGADWTIDEGKAKASYYHGSTYSHNDNYLVTPPLTVSGTSDELIFDYITTASNVNIVIQKSKDGGEWTTCTATPAIPTPMSNGTAGTATITGLEAGSYQFRFKNDDYNLDNFEGFVLNLPDHMATITGSSIPESPSWDITMKQGKSFDATVTVKEQRGVAEELTAKLYMGEEVIGTKVGSVSAKGTETLTITCTPTVAAPEGAQMHIEVEWAGTKMTTDNVTRYVAALNNLTLNEESSDAIVAGTYDNLTLKRKFTAGWNTVCLPFTISDVEAFFGSGAKAYNFTSYSEGTLGFTSVNDNLTASYPYVVYVPTAITEDIELTDITIDNNDTEGWYTSFNSAYFRGTYVPIAAGDWTKKAGDDKLYGVTSAGKIAKIGDTATSKGFRGYFDLPAGATARLSFYDETTGITTVMDAKELNNDGKVYNLNGQRVENAHKGLYIVNGRKVVVK